MLHFVNVEHRLNLCVVLLLVLDVTHVVALNSVNECSVLSNHTYNLK